MRAPAHPITSLFTHLLRPLLQPSPTPQPDPEPEPQHEEAPAEDQGAADAHAADETPAAAPGKQARALYDYQASQ
jgi:hypothetical protein